jgi:hypothetical protein
MPSQGIPPDKRVSHPPPAMPGDLTPSERTRLERHAGEMDDPPIQPRTETLSGCAETTSQISCPSPYPLPEGEGTVDEAVSAQPLRVELPSSLSPMERKRILDSILQCVADESGAIEYEVR